MGSELDDSLARVAEAKAGAEKLLAAGDADAVKQRYLGRKGAFRELQQLLKTLPGEDRKAFGKAFNQAQKSVETAWKQAASGSKKQSAGPSFDFLPGVPAPPGSKHPLRQTIEEITEIFARMGFAHAEGPELEDVFHNFVALNIPDDHPARDPRDNFYLKGDHDRLLRSQTSTVQIRTLQAGSPPVRIISIGRVYRPDEADDTHSPMFHQVEGLMVDEGVTMAHLKTVLRLFTQAYLGRETAVRFRPSFFPFTEPSIEADMKMADGSWVELGGAGMVDPNVLRAVDVDPERYTGFAFGLGVERMAMGRYGVTDLRQFFGNDVRFLRQFA